MDDENEKTEAENTNYDRCSRCRGSGVVWFYIDENGDEQESEYERICPNCDGYGRFD